MSNMRMRMHTPTHGDASIGYLRLKCKAESESLNGIFS